MGPQIGCHIRSADPQSAPLRTERILKSILRTTIVRADYGFLIYSLRGLADIYINLNFQNIILLIIIRLGIGSGRVGF